ncbi:MAG TPA: sodium:glutamate symporter [Candidatus Marinimicrobia bacterium]|nr:sodium:glutamate symporter [Candidatus Neomarinimicrobiota bacterium]
MNIPFQFEPMLTFGFLSIMLLIGIILRNKLRFFQYFLIPSCLLGGILGLVFVSTGIIKIEASSLENVAYHFFNISFISVGLSGSNENEKNAIRGKDYIRGSAWMAVIQSISFSLQAVIGVAVVILLEIFGMKLFPTFGFLVSLGFEEGPGQALSFGKVWESIGFEHAATIGLTFAAIGFLISFFVGVPIANWGIRKGHSTLAPSSLPKHFLKGIVPKGHKKESAGNLTMHSGNIETLAFHAALIGLVYILSYVVTLLLGKLLPPDIGKMLWGFFFFIGMVIAFLVRISMKKLKIDHLIDSGLQRRITGFAVDYLIVSTVMAIQLVVIWKYIIPISIIALISGFTTTFMVIFFGRRLWSYNIERSVTIYGTVTGTVSSGLLLLRIVDPEFKTPVAVEIGLMNLFMVPAIVC